MSDNDINSFFFFFFLKRNLRSRAMSCLTFGFPPLGFALALVSSIRLLACHAFHLFCFGFARHIHLPCFSSKSLTFCLFYFLNSCQHAFSFCCLLLPSSLTLRERKGCFLLLSSLLMTSSCMWPLFALGHN